MTPEHPYYSIARFTLEAATPLSIASGTRNGGFDSALATDASGLPFLPGTSLAGVLRSEYQRRFNSDETNALFGWQEKDQGNPSVLHVASGVLQDSFGHPHEGIPTGREQRTHLQNDEVLAHAFEQLNRPVFRDAVRVSHRGTADATGKFERVILPAGNRFSCEIALWSTIADDPRWLRICKLLGCGTLRVGAGTRNGLGVITIRQLHTQSFKLDDGKGYAAFAALGRDIDDVSGLEPQSLTDDSSEARLLTATLRLKPRSYWRVGQGKSALGSYDDGNVPRLLPLTEPRILWENGKGHVGEAEVLLPGSSIKGALAHRHCFHLNRLQGKWAAPAAGSLPEYDKSEDETLRALYGFARDSAQDKDQDKRVADAKPENKRGQKKPTGQAGRLFVSDVFVSQIAGAVSAMPHNVIDRFTGGVRDRLLFAEELIWHTPVEVQVSIDKEAVENSLEGASLTLLKSSLDLALKDLIAGRLALGSACARGHGFFSGAIEWSDDGAWIAGDSTNEEKGAA